MAMQLELKEVPFKSNCNANIIAPNVMQAAETHRSQCLIGGTRRLARSSVRSHQISEQAVAQQHIVHRQGGSYSAGSSGVQAEAGADMSATVV
jgi:hypothetical protein